MRTYAPQSKNGVCMVKPLLKQTLHLLAFGETLLVRFWFSLAGYMWAIMITYSQTFAHNVKLLDMSAPTKVWVLLFIIHASAMLYGVMTSIFCGYLLYLEGVLGLILWGSTAVSYWMINGYPDPTLIGALIAIHLFIRYPQYPKSKKR